MSTINHKELAVALLKEYRAKLKAFYESRKSIQEELAKLEGKRCGYKTGAGTGDTIWYGTIRSVDMDSKAPIRITDLSDGRHIELPLVNVVSIDDD